MQLQHYACVAPLTATQAYMIFDRAWILLRYDAALVNC